MNTAENNPVIVAFSGRKDGNCDKIARHIRSLYGGRLFSLADMDIQPCGKCAYECFSDAGACPHIADGVRDIYEAVTRSRTAIYILPNYCDFPNANFFAFNERSLCFFSGRDDLLNAYLRVRKKFIIVSGSRPQSFLDALSQHAEEPDILFLSAKQYGQKSTDGNLTTSPDALSEIENFLL
ncbi:MAG: hypothetical protein IJO98_01735 [Clostridia bacterium]|nr:hypothetical protein [Clostridia bacterium]